jgi:hypothetical protein
MQAPANIGFHLDILKEGNGESKKNEVVDLVIDLAPDYELFGFR